MTLLENTRQHLEAVLTVAEKNKMDVFEEMHLSFYQTSLIKKINDQEKDVSTAALIVDNRRNEAVQARQERQVVEKLKEKDLQNYKREVNAREQKEVDELALYAYLRRKKQFQPGTV